jgi:hypothetical protein
MGSIPIARSRNPQKEIRCILLIPQGSRLSLVGEQIDRENVHPSANEAQNALVG